MIVFIRTAVPYRKRALHGPFTRHSLPEVLCSPLREPMVGLLLAAAFGILIALLLISPVSALIVQGGTGEGTIGITSAAANPVLVPPSGDLSTYPSIASNESTGLLCRQFPFPFQKTNVTVSIRVNASLYYGAKNGDKSATVPEGTVAMDAAPAYYRAFIEDPRQDEMYAELLHTLRAIRQEYRYSDDEYLELLTVFVQSLPYDTVSGTRPDTPARFPAETLVDGTGDCDDKSLLLAGLLAREGYDTALLLFLPEHHMAVGVKDEGAGYGNSGYLYVETTGVSLIGVVPANLSQSVKYVPAGQSSLATPLTSIPLVIREGTGTLVYSSADETAFIAEQKTAVNTKIALLRSQLDTFSGDDPSRYRQLMEDYYVYTGIHNTLVRNPYDRVGEYQYLKKIAPEFLCTGSTDSHTAGVLVLPDFSLTESGTCQACFPLTLRRSGQCSPGNRAALSR